MAKKPLDVLHGLFDENDKDYTGPKLTDKKIRDVERDLGYKLPASYLRLIRIRNGGALKRGRFPLKKKGKSVTVQAMRGIGGDWGIDSEALGSRRMIEEWGYPDVGIVIGDSPSAGHDTFMLDYSKCGPRGEPRVIHVETETADGKPHVTVLAPDFETFLRGLEEDE